MDGGKSRLIERMRSEGASNPRASAHQRRTVRLLADEIREVLDDGEPVIAIWRHLQSEGRVTVCYQTFARYVRTMLNKPRNGADKPARGDIPPPPAPDLVPGVPARGPRPVSTGRTFVHDPSPKAEDLI